MSPSASATVPSGHPIDEDGGVDDLEAHREAQPKPARSGRSAKNPTNALPGLPRSLAQSFPDPGSKSDGDGFWIDAVDEVLIVAVTDLNGTITYANQKFCDISGYSQQELIGANHRLINSGTHDRAFFREMFRAIRSGKTWRGEICNKAKDGTLYWVATTIIPHLDEGGSPTHYVACRFDITEQKNAQLQLAEAASVDSLTGLLNRSAFQSGLAAVLQRCEAGGEEAAVVMLDLDHFKDVNDIYGHDTADELLKIVSQRIVRAVRPTDLVSRLGGDEFALVFSPLPPHSRIEELLERVQDAVHMPLNLGLSKTSVSASIGVACFPTDGTDPSDLLKNADIALYKAKHLGRNRFEFFTPSLLRSMTRRVTLQGQARLGPMRGEFELHYQPIISIATGRLESLEALLRWNHPDQGLITPGRFMDIFDDHRLAAAIGTFVRRAAIDQAAAWRRSGVSFGKVAINVTTPDLAQPGFTDLLVSDLQARNIGADAIAIEITEGILLGKQSVRVREEIDALYQRGFEIAFDDFGVGYASLTHLKELPLHRIKIDRSFIQELAGSDSDRKIVRGIIDLAHSLDLIVTAEGVETREQMAILRQDGCDRAQGFLIARPLPPDAVAGFIRKRDHEFHKA